MDREVEEKIRNCHKAKEKERVCKEGKAVEAWGDTSVEAIPPRRWSNISQPYDDYISGNYDTKAPTA